MIVHLCVLMALICSPCRTASTWGLEGKTCIEDVAYRTDLILRHTIRYIVLVREDKEAGSH